MTELLIFSILPHHGQEVDHILSLCHLGSLFLERVRHAHTGTVG